MGSARFSECRELFVGTRRCQEQLSTTSLPPPHPPRTRTHPKISFLRHLDGGGGGGHGRRRARLCGLQCFWGCFGGGMRGPEKNWRLRFAPFNKCPPPQKTVSLVKKQNNMMHSLNGEAIACRYCSVVENLPVRIATRESRYRIPAS